jgi:hypothetical protein
MNIKHGHTKTTWQSKTYTAWKHMKHRCYNKNNPYYKDYGGRGITVCDRWIVENGFINFLEDMGESPPGLSIDRIDNNLGYSKENCKWSTNKEQTRNKRNNRLIVFGGRTQCLASWAEERMISPKILKERLDKLGWSIKKALTTPVKEYRKRNNG